MSEHVNPGNLAAAIRQELSIYSDSVTDGVNEAGAKAIKKLEKITKATAPVGARGRFKSNISNKAEPAAHGMKKYIWYVKPPDHRLTHLLVHGHATVNGGRTRANPFLQNALDQVLPEYEKDVEEAVKNGK